MILPEIADIARSEISGGSSSPDSSLSYNFLYNLVDNGRELMIRNEFKQYKRTDPSWFQKYTPVYSKDFQEGTHQFVKYEVPPVIALDGVQDGHGYIGGVECLFDFRICNNKAALTAMTKHRVSDFRSGRFSIVLFEGTIMEIYSIVNITTPPSMSAIWRKPSELSTYNIATDQYPCGDIKQLIRTIMDNDLIIITKSAIDRVRDGFNNSQAPMKPAVA